MTKKRRAKAPKEKRLKKALLWGGAIFLAVSVSLVVLGVVLAHVQDEKDKISYEYLRETLEKDYLDDPWDGVGREEAKASLEKKEGAMWALFEALMCIEDDRMAGGYKGVELESDGNTLCVDLSGFENSGWEASARRFFENYCKRKNLLFREGTREELKKEGRIDEATGTYLDGCHLSVGLPYEDDGTWTTDFYFHYANFHGNGATVIALPSDRWEEYALDRYLTDKEHSDDGVWACYIDQSLIS